MPNTVLLAENAGSYLYRIGRIGLDVGTKDGQDVSGSGGYVYTAILESEKISPLGEGGEAQFRRVVLRILRSGSFTCALRVYVDDKQTKLGDGTDQEVTFVFGSPEKEFEETLLEADIDAVGTFISIELEVTSTDLSGILLAESAWVHADPITDARVSAVREAT